MVKLPNLKQVKARHYNQVRNLKRRIATFEARLKEKEKQVQRLRTLQMKSKTKKGKGIGKHRCADERQQIPDLANVQDLPVPGHGALDAPDLPHRDEHQVENQNAQQEVAPVQVEQNVTPKKAAIQLMEEQNLSPVEFPELAKEITAYKTLVAQVLKAPKKIRINLLRSKCNTKARVASKLAKEIGVNRKSVFAKQRKNIEKRQQYRIEKARVVHFLKTPPHSTPLPGQKDITARGQQKYAINDTLSNLYKKYRNKYPDSKMSLATFCRQRPPYMRTINYTDRRQCLCVHHENGVLKLKALKKPTSISKFLNENTDQDIETMLEGLSDEVINFREWQREDIPYQDSFVRKLRLKEVEIPKDEFCEKFKDEFTDLRQHVVRMNNQFEELEQLKNNLPPLTAITCQVDYSENFCCSFQDEPSQAFYDRSQVTLHPMVINYKNNEGLVKHKSFVGITGEKLHSAPTTFAFIKHMIPKVQELLPRLSVVHYISDSPVSQYRNKSILHIVANHSEYFPGVSSSWDYLESGHGKGPCDGVGGAIKRFANNAIKSGTIIGNASQFYDWAKENNQKMDCFFITSADIKNAERILKNAKAAKGLSKSHSLRPFNGYIYMRTMSCYKQCCLQHPSCSGWEKTAVKVSQPDEVQDVEVQDETVQIPVYDVGQKVEINYNGKLYGVLIEEYNEENHEYQVKFLKKNRSGTYVSPRSTWSAWVSVNDVVNLTE